MKNTNKETVITGMMVVKAAMGVALVAAAVLFGMGIINADCRMVGEASLIACVQTGFWSYTYLTKNKDKKAGKNEVVA